MDTGGRMATTRDRMGLARFLNARARHRPGLFKGLKAGWRFLTGQQPDAKPSKPIDMVALTRAALLQAPDDSLWRLGHSSILLKLAGKFWLLDPVFAQRVSPLPFMGPKRFHPVPLAAAELPEIEAVVVSHDHYDHLDRQLLQAIQHKVRWFVVPQGVGDRLVAWGVPPHKIRQLGWWDSTQIDQVRLTATPAQHFSGRGMTDGNRTLWASWVVQGPNSRVFFSGDSGYFDGFAAIGQRHGPFDLTLLENGAYNEDWPDIHMQPEQTVQAHLDLRGRCLVPVHNGTFALALHGWQEPMERLLAAAQDVGVPVSTPRMGERLDIRAPHNGYRWWREAAQQTGQPASVRDGLRTTGPTPTMVPGEQEVM